MIGEGVFADLLGPEYDRLAPLVRSVHCGRPIRLVGRASVMRGDSSIAHLLCWLFRLPRDQRDAPMTVDLEARGSRETLSRTYGASAVMRSRIERRRSLLVERFGAMALHFRLAARGADLEWSCVRATAFGVPLPGRLFRRISARACERNGRYAFSVSVTLPLIGQLISYEGAADVIA